MSSQPDGPDIEKAVSHAEQQEKVNSEVATPPVVSQTMTLNSRSVNGWPFW
jgi:hypothetical protein